MAATLGFEAESRWDSGGRGGVRPRGGRKANVPPLRGWRGLGLGVLQRWHSYGVGDEASGGVDLKLEISDLRGAGRLVIGDAAD